MSLHKQFQQARFLGSAASMDGCDRIVRSGLPEIAVVGRSNVGKSSLLNLLFGRRSLAKTSSTPGKTRLVNYFGVGDALMMVDLPGYGFASASKRTQADWARLVDRYLNERQSLALVLLLLDLRRTPTHQDRELVEWARAAGKTLLLIFTKADKVPRTQRDAHAKQVAAELGLSDRYVLSSAKSKLGSSEVAGAIVRHLPRGTRGAA